MTPQQFGEWRSWLGLTQVQVAKLLSINKRTVSLYEVHGPIPETVALACEAITNRSEPLDYKPLIEKQHPQVQQPFLVMPHPIERVTSFRRVYCIQDSGEPEFNSELIQWRDGQELPLRSVVLTLLLPDTRRRDLAVILFEDEAARDAFVWRWR